jgi:beta-lactamase class A
LRAVVEPVLAGPPPKPATARSSFDARALSARLSEITASHAGVYGVVVHDPESGESVSLRADETFYAASIGKLPTLIALYRSADRDELNLGDEISILPGDVQSYGSGVLHTYPLYSTLSLRECAGYLVKQSDNTAWVMLDRRLGQRNIQAELDALGAHDTDYALHTTTPNDVLRMLKSIADPAFTSEAFSAEMLSAMTDTAYEDRIPASLPRDVRVAHKIGSYGDSFGDAGIVFFKDARGTERHYYVVVLAEDTTEADAREAIQEISRAAYEALARPRRPAL